MRSMGHKPVNDWIKFELAGRSPSGKTKKWLVRNTNMPVESDPLGFVHWHGAWRKYVYSCENSFYDPECLRLIADFCENATKEHYAKI